MQKRPNPIVALRYGYRWWQHRERAASRVNVNGTLRQTRRLVTVAKETTLLVCYGVLRSTAFSVPPIAHWRLVLASVSQQQHVLKRYTVDSFSCGAQALFGSTVRAFKSNFLTSPV
jgi:hypothetical protein